MTWNVSSKWTGTPGRTAAVYRYPPGDGTEVVVQGAGLSFANGPQRCGHVESVLDGTAPGDECFSVSDDALLHENHAEGIDDFPQEEYACIGASAGSMLRIARKWSSESCVEERPSSKFMTCAGEKWFISSGRDLYHLEEKKVVDVA